MSVGIHTVVDTRVVIGVGVESTRVILTAGSFQEGRFAVDSGEGWSLEGFLVLFGGHFIQSECRSDIMTRTIGTDIRHRNT